MVDVPEKTKPRLFLIDGYALVYRAFFAMISRPLTTSRGENTSAAFGFARFLKKILEEYEPDYLGVVLDAGTSARKTRYPEYKATREKMPDELRASIPRIRQLLEAFRVPVLELQDHEADDVIGTLAQRAADESVEVVIVSGDKDFYQLIGPGVSLLNPGRGGSANVEEEWVDERNASERLGVQPERVTDYLALIGDSSDNVPGVRGVGPKTARKLLDEYGPVEQVIEHASEISGKRAREAIEAGESDIRLSKELVTILRDLPVELDLDALAVSEPDREKLREIFVELEFHSLAREMDAAVSGRDVTARAELEVADTVEAVTRIVAAARKAGRLAIWVEPTDPTPLRGTIVGIGIAIEPGKAWYLPVRHRKPGVLDLEGVQVRNLPALESPDMAPLAQLLEDAHIGKTGHDVKRDLELLAATDVILRGADFDTQIASYVLEPGRRDHALDELALQHFGHRTRTRDEATGKGRDAVPIDEVPVERAAEYVAASAEAVLKLRKIFDSEMQAHHLDRLFHDIEMPLVEVLVAMETAGIRIDIAFFQQLGKKVSRDLDLVQQEIWKIAGEQFNINSTPQLRTVLFEKLELPVLRRTKTGPSTDASVLEELAEQGHELPNLLLQYRQLDKLKGTYIDALPQQVNKTTGRIHTSFSQTVAATGRLSSNNPNLQNIPIRTDVGAELRKGFIPADGYRFISADYSQIELRILAHFSGDPAFVEAFRAHKDIHRQTAAVMFGVEVQDVSAQMRAAAKTVNFATIYGIGAFALSKQLGTSVADAKNFIEEYFTRFPGVRRYLDEQIEHARTHGYVETLSGRRRYIPEIKHRNYNIRQFGERAATNAPVQGSAADIIKIAMIQIHARLRREGAGARMLLQVHDELVLEAPEAEVESTRKLVKELMEGAFELDVPLEVETGVGANWFECK